MRAIPSAKHFYLVWIFMIFIFALMGLPGFSQYASLCFQLVSVLGSQQIFRDMNIISVGRISIILPMSNKIS